jgi:hypothetical protein
VVVTVLVASGCDTAVEAALDGMAAEHTEGASIHMRGPLPPLSFSSVRLEMVEEQAVIDAWAALGLTSRVDPSGLHRHRREHACRWRLARYSPALTCCKGGLPRERRCCGLRWHAWPARPNGR